MKTKLLKLGFTLAVAFPLLAAPANPKGAVQADMVVSHGDNRGYTFKGSAVVSIGDLKISADQIVYDKAKGVLQCIGECTISSSEITIKATNATIDVKDGEPDMSAKEAIIPGIVKPSR